jgi:hypothetical protein
MPEPYWPKRKGSYTLAAASRNSQFARLRCRYCKIERYYLIADLITVFGNVECDDMLYMRDWRCTSCKERNTLDMQIGDPSAAVRQQINIRKIDRIEYVRKINWTDE